MRTQARKNDLPKDTQLGSGNTNLASVPMLLTTVVNHHMQTHVHMHTHILPNARESSVLVIFQK